MLAGFGAIGLAVLLLRARHDRRTGRGQGRGNIIDLRSADAANPPPRNAGRSARARSGASHRS
jgi:hypothetical protein